MIRFICEHYSGSCDTMYVGTGNCRKTIGFYEKCGFVNSHIVANFFVDHYQEPIYEDGVRLVDMVYLKKRLESEVDVKKVVDLALEAGRILLKNGAEIFRVEETITRICQRFHVDQVDIFTLSHAIFVSAENGMEEALHEGEAHALCPAPTLGIVAEVNDLSREIAAGRVTMEEAAKKLKEIDEMPPKRPYFQILAAGASSASLGFLLGVHGDGERGCLPYRVSPVCVGADGKAPPYVQDHRQSGGRRGDHGAGAVSPTDPLLGDA